MKPHVVEAVQDVRQAFADFPVRSWPESQGGAFVVIEGLSLGSRWETATTWLGFLVSYLHPDADCYPHFVRPDLARADGKELKPPVHADNKFGDISAVMVSRSSPSRRPEFNSPSRKALSVLEFLRGLE